MNAIVSQTYPIVENCERSMLIWRRLLADSTVPVICKENDTLRFPIFRRTAKDGQAKLCGAELLSCTKSQKSNHKPESDSSSIFVGSFAPNNR